MSTRQNDRRSTFPSDRYEPSEAVIHVFNAIVVVATVAFFASAGIAQQADKQGLADAAASSGTAAVAADPAG